MFRRRHPIPLLERVLSWLWPPIGWRRATAYVVVRVKRLPGTPRSIAAGFACGVMVSFTPFFPHLASAALFALLIRGSVLAAWVGTLVGNPSTFPIIWLAAYNLGLVLMGQEPVSDQVFAAQSRLVHLPDPYTLEWFTRWIERATDWAMAKFVPMAIGGVPLGLAAGFLSYLIIVRLVSAVQAARLRRRERVRATRAHGAALEAEQPSAGAPVL